MAATLAFDVQQPTVVPLFTIRIREEVKIRRHHEEEETERTKIYSEHGDATASRQLSGRIGVWALWVRCLSDSIVLASLLASGSVSLYNVYSLWKEGALMLCTVTATLAFVD